MSASPSSRPAWATVGRMSSPGFTTLSTASPSPTKEDEKGLRSSVATSSPRMFSEYGSPGRCGGSGLGARSGSKSDYDIIRFFTARDIIDLINNLQRSAKIARDEAVSIHGSEQVNRIKAKCSKVCGLANRLIDLYVATIKAKVARILRKLGLGQTRGQELLYHHLMLLQALVDKAFASFNAVQHAEAARIKQAKLGLVGRRENSGAVTWRTPATPGDRKPSFRPGSLGSLPQPAQHLDVKDLMLEARKQFLLMADELVDLKNKIISVDRRRIHEAVVAAVAEGEVPDPLLKVKAPPDGIAYGFNTRYVSEGACGSALTFGRSSSVRAAAEAGTPAIAVSSPLNPRREATASPTMPYSPRTSRLIHTSFEVPQAVKMTTAAAASDGMNQLRPHLPGHAGLRSVSVPGDAAGSQIYSPSMGSPFTPNTFQVLTPRSRMAISHGGDPEHSSNVALSRQAPANTLLGEDKMQGAAQGPDAALLLEPAGVATCNVTRVGMRQAAFSRGDPSVAAHPFNAAALPVAVLARDFCADASVSAAPALPYMRSRSSTDGCQEATLLQPSGDAAIESSGRLCKHLSDASGIYPKMVLEERLSSPEDASPREHKLQARTATSEVLPLQAARIGQQLVRLRCEKEDGRKTLRKLALEALRLVTQDTGALESSLAALNMARAQLDDASLRTQACDASEAELQAMLRICLTLLGQQLRAQALQPAATASSAAMSPCGGHGASAQPTACPRCGELAALLDQVLPLLSSTSIGDRIAISDLGSARRLPELAADGSQDEVVFLPLATERDAVETGEMANEALATVLQRLSTVLDHLRRLEENSADLEQALSRERKVRTDTEAEAARLHVDQNETNATLVMTQKLLAESEQQLEDLRAQLVDANRQLGDKSVEIASLQQQQQQRLRDGRSKHATAAPPVGMGLFGVNMLNATEMELEGLRIEHENLRAKTELQGTELRQLQNEVSGLRAARDKLVEELQEMHQLLEERELASVEDVPLLTLTGRSTPDGKAAARAPSHGAPGAVGMGSMMSRNRNRSLATSAGLALNETISASGPGAAHGSGRATSSTITSKAAARMGGRKSMSSLSSNARLLGSGTAIKHSVKSGIPQGPGLPQPGAALRRSESSSGMGTPRDHFCALARLEEIQVQLAQAEAARQALECQLQAAQEVIASKESELDTANLMLLEYERRSLSAACPALKAAKPLTSANVPLPQLGGDGLAVIASTLALGGLTGNDHAALTPDGSTRRHDNLIVRLEELQTQCEELISRAADLDTQQNQAQLDAEEREAELEAIKEYIQELEEEVELLREIAEKAKLQMQEKEQDMVAQELALLEARDALARAQADCDAQVNYVEAQAAQLEQAQAELLAAQARVLELEARDEEQSRADADALGHLRAETVLLQSQYTASQVALVDATQELANARAAVEDSDQVASAHRQAIQALRAQASETEARPLELMQKLSSAEDAQASLPVQLAASAENRQQLMAQLEVLTKARDDMAAQLDSKQAALTEALVQLEENGASCQQLESRLQVDAGEREDLRMSLTRLMMEHAALQRQVVNNRTAVRDLAEKVGETEKARAEVAEKLQKSPAACSALEQKFASAEGACREQQASLTSADLQACIDANLTYPNSTLKIAAAKLATTGAARDGAYYKAVAADAARQELQSQLDVAEAKVQALSNHVHELEDQLQSVQEREIAMQEQATAFASARAAEAEQAVANLQAALSDVQTRLETLRSEAAVQAAKVARLETKLAQAALEQERLELQAATATAHSQMLEDQLRQAKAENAQLEEELAASRAEVAAQVEMSALQADQLTAAYAFNAEQEKRFAVEAEGFKAQLEAVLADNAEVIERSACQAAELEAQIAAAHAESAQQAAHFTAQASSLEAQLSDARTAVEQQAQISSARIRALEEQLAEAQASSSKLAEMHRVYVEELEAKLDCAQSAINEHTVHTAARVEELEGQLSTARAKNALEAERSTSQVAMLLEEIIAARAMMVEQAHASAARAMELESQLSSARSAVAALNERSAAAVSDLVSNLDVARKAGAVAAEQAAQKVMELEAQLATAQSEHAALANCYSCQVAELEARLVAALAENAEQAKRSAAQAADLESQLAAAMAIASEHAAVQTAELALQLEAARADLSERTQRSSADAALLVKQLEAAHAEIAGQIKKSAAQTSVLEQQLSTARAENNDLLSRSALQSAALEAQIVRAQEQHAAHAEASAVQVAELEKRLEAARSEIADRLKCSSQHLEALEERLVAAHTEYAVQSERSAAQTRDLEAQLAVAQAAIAEQVQTLAMHAATLEAELAVARAEKLDLAARLASQRVELEARLTETRNERDAEAERHATRVANLQMQLSSCRADAVQHASRTVALVATFEEQMAAAREDSTAQARQMWALEAELRSVVFALGAAKASQEKQAEDVQQLLKADLEQKKQLDLRQSEAQQLKTAVAGLQATLEEREAAVAHSGLQLDKARQDLEAAVAALGHLQTTVDRLQAAAAAASAAGVAASSTATAAADQQQANLAATAKEQVRLRALVSELEGIASNQSRLVLGLRDDVSTLPAAQDAAAEQLREPCQNARRQDAVAAELCRGLGQRQHMLAAPEMEAAAERVHQDQVNASEVAGVENVHHTTQVLLSPMEMDGNRAASQQELTRLGSAAEAAQRCADAQYAVVAHAERQLQAAERATSEAQTRRCSAEADVSVLQELQADLEAQASGRCQLSYSMQEQSEAMARELASVQQLINRQRQASAGLLEGLTTKLAAANSDLRNAKDCVTELQGQLEDATRRAAAAEQAVLTADVEKRNVEARLAAAMADSNDGRVIVQELTAELARYREEVERVRMSLVAKQARLDKQEPKRRAPQQVGCNSQRRDSSPSAATDMELHVDADLSEDFLEGCIWGMGLNAQHTRTGDLGAPAMHCSLARGTASHRQDGIRRCEPPSTAIFPQRAPPDYDQDDLESHALRLRELGCAGADVLELMSQGWHGMETPAAPVLTAPGAADPACS